MRIFIAFALLVAATSARAQSATTAGGVAGAHAATAHAPAPAAGTTSGVDATLPPPPPASVTTPPSAAGVPPTPAPAVAGLPSPSSPAGSLPSQQGFSSQVNNELRPSPSLSTDDVATVQASLAAGGLYRGPVDGIYSGATRAAIREFQQVERIPVTGNLDAETMARLQRGSVGTGVGTNGSTSTSGNRAATGDIFGGVTPTTPTSTTPTTHAPSMPFQLSSPVNTSPAPPPGTVVQP